MDTIHLVFTEEEMYHFVIDLLDLKKSYSRRTEYSHLTITVANTEDCKNTYDYRRIQKRVFNRLSVPERKKNFIGANKKEI